MKEFDNLRLSLKSKLTTRSLQKVEKYKALTGELGIKLLNERSKLDQEVKSFEHAYFSEHGRLPDQKEDTYRKLLSTRHYVKTIIRYLKIAL